jgi:hypothetical protein
MPGYNGPPIRGHIGTHIIDGFLLNGKDSKVELAFSLQAIRMTVFQKSGPKSPMKKTYACCVEPKLGQHFGHTIGMIVKIIEYSRRFI